MATADTKDLKTKKPRTDRKFSVQKAQTVLTAIAARIKADETAELKLTVKELTSLGNTAANISKTLWEVDKEKIRRERTIARGKTELFRN